MSFFYARKNWGKRSKNKSQFIIRNQVSNKFQLLKILFHYRVGVCARPEHENPYNLISINNYNNIYGQSTFSNIICSFSSMSTESITTESVFTESTENFSL